MELFNKLEFQRAKQCEFLRIKCDYCGEETDQKKKTIQAGRRRHKKQGNFCSVKCARMFRNQGLQPREVKCKECKVSFYKVNSEIIKSPNHFCSQSCSATYNNARKTHGTRRSKLEAWLERELIKLYPDLEIHFNRKDAINSELDIYIPALKLAIELNGIFHYEPIYGDQKLSQIQNNDNRKFAACHENGISLCIIDTSSHSYVTPNTSKKYLDIIVKLVDEKMVVTAEIESATF